MAVVITYTTYSTVPWSPDFSTIVVEDQTGFAISANLTGDYPATFCNIRNRFQKGAEVTNTTTLAVYRNLGTPGAPNFIDITDAGDFTAAEIGSSAITAAKIGTAAVTSPKIDPQVVNLSTVPITAAAMIDTAAGIGMSSTNGLTIVPAAPTGYVNVWHRTIVSYTFATAAYTGGGNTTVNIGGGGAAMSGLIATTTLWQNGSSIIQEFVPLSTVAFPITKETAISLKTASAITNPGTAAGTAIVYTWYSQVAI